VRCLSLENYIKPQHKPVDKNRCACCLSLENYIKPQPSPKNPLFLGYFRGFFILKMISLAHLEVDLVSFSAVKDTFQYVNEQLS
jgi:hypothetical protein